MAISNSVRVLFRSKRATTNSELFWNKWHQEISRGKYRKYPEELSETTRIWSQLWFSFRRCGRITRCGKIGNFFNCIYSFVGNTLRRNYLGMTRVLFDYEFFFRVINNLYVWWKVLMMLFFFEFLKISTRQSKKNLLYLFNYFGTFGIMEGNDT